MSEFQGNIVLCGFMGCGKTTVGRKLAAKMGRKFVDIDQYIERKAGMTVTQIFEAYQEKGFREMEAQAVRELSRREGLVIASGGGTVLFPRNIRAFHEGGDFILMLDVPLPVLQERLKNDTRRPLLQVPEHRRKVVGDLYHKRIAKYRAAADLEMKATAPPWIVAKRIVAASEGFDAILAERARQRAKPLDKNAGQ